MTQEQQWICSIFIQNKWRLKFIQFNWMAFSANVFCFCVFCLLGLFCLIVLPVAAESSAASQQTRLSQQSRPSWSKFVQDLRRDALAEGIRPEIFDMAFRNIHEPNRRVLRYDRNQPERRLTLQAYRRTRADHYRILLGRKAYRRHHVLLEEIGDRYGVSACFITALWGLETSYGRYMGKFPVIKSLATLAYDTRRSAFFRKQLMYALHILNDGHVELKDFKGEWAGASGHPQFLPSSWHRYAVDYNGDGRKDIWRSYPDVFASIANYLKQNGWRAGQPWAIAVHLPMHFNSALLTRDVKKSVSTWLAMGIRPMQGHRLPNDHQLLASVIEPEGGPALMIFNNFNVIMQWNRSTYYAATVGYLAEQICQRPL